MEIDYNLVDRLIALNKKGISYFAIANLAHVGPATVRRFAVGHTSRMTEDVHLKTLRAVETLEKTEGVIIHPIRPKGEATDGTKMILALIGFSIGLNIAMLILFPR